jgi:hypothetical protein
MVATSKDSNLVVGYLVNQTVFVINTLRPATGEVVLQWLRLTDSSKGFGRCILDKPKNSQCLFAILLNPPNKIFDRGKVKFQVSGGLRQAKNPRFVPWPPKVASALTRS